MDFTRFEGEGVRMWLDNCESYFPLYQIPENYKLMSASLHLHDNAAHWYQAVKFTEACNSWKSFSAAVLAEFDMNVHKTCIRDLLVLKQTDTVQEYRNAFNQFVYQVRLDEGSVSDTLLVMQFRLVLKEEIKSEVEIQLPNSVQAATEYALVQETMLLRGKHHGGQVAKYARNKGYANRGEFNNNKQQFGPGDVWKFRKLKEYRRSNGLCVTSAVRNLYQVMCAPTKWHRQRQREMEKF